MAELITTKRISPETGATLFYQNRPFTVMAPWFPEYSETIESVPGWYSRENEDDAIFDDDGLALIEDAQKRMKVAFRNFLVSLRQQHNLSQRDAGLILGGGPSAFQKYEAGTIVPRGAMGTLLSVLARHPEEVTKLVNEYSYKHREYA
jgi:HTH-type transcriptional regulator/antitoxin MqsA